LFVELKISDHFTAAGDSPAVIAKVPWQAMAARNNPARTGINDIK
jgi:hypothetical protein